MKRGEWKKMANEHIKSARALLASGHNSAAYHLAGLALECAFKAKISRVFKNDTWPDKTFVQEIHTHDLERLVQQSGLGRARQMEDQRSPAFRAHWNTVKQWRIESRYKEWSPAEATDMVNAAARRGAGVLAWIKRHW